MELENSTHSQYNVAMDEHPARHDETPDDEKRVCHDLDDLVGTWVEDPVFDEVIREMDSVDADLWR